MERECHIFQTTESKTLIIYYLYYLSLVYHVQDCGKTSKLSIELVNNLWKNKNVI